MKTVSKSSFKAKALEYFREVESTGRELVITDHGRPVVKILPYARETQKLLEEFRGTVHRYTDPMEPVGLEDWEALR